MLKKSVVIILIVFFFITTILFAGNIAIHSDQNIGWHLKIYNGSQHIHTYQGVGNWQRYFPNSWEGYRTELWRWATVLDDEGTIPYGNGWLDLYIQVAIEDPGEPPED